MGKALNGRLATVLFWLFLAVQALLVCRVTSPWLSGDSAVYLDLAQSLSNGHYGLVTANGLEFDALRPPGYAIILWLFLHVLSLPTWAVIGLQCAAYFCAIWLVDRYFASEAGAQFGFRLLVLIYPFPLVYSSYVMTEAWTILAVTAVAVILCSSRPTMVSSAAAGLLCGVAALLRSDLLLLPIVAAFALLISRADDYKRSAAMGFAILAASAATLLPYAIWNQRHFGIPSPAPVASAVGTSLYLSTWQGRLPLADLNALYAGRATPAAIQSGLIAEVSEVNRSIGAQPLTAPFNPANYPTQKLQIAMNKAFAAKAAERIRTMPLQYGEHVVRNLWALWNTTEYPASLPRAAVLLLSAISYVVMAAGYVGALLSLFGAGALGRWRPAVFVMLYPLAIHLWLHTEARYTASVRPLLLFFAAIAMVVLYRRLRSGEVGLVATEA